MSGFDFHFEWDGAKAATNLAKHGVTFEAAASVLRDPLAVTVFDSEHSRPAEERWVTIGREANGACMVVVHTWEDLASNSARVRVVSARRATKQEQRVYEEGQ